jgi:hypothetical protein
LSVVLANAARPCLVRQTKADRLWAGLPVSSNQPSAAKRFTWIWTFWRDVVLALAIWGTV